MANEEHLLILKKGVEMWNRWRKERIIRNPDLSGADLRGLVLEEANLAGTLLEKALLVDANLCEANLAHADLGWADLRRADLSEANLEYANLEYAIFSDAQYRDEDPTCVLPPLSFTWFRFNSELNGANFAMAYLHGTNFGDGADLRGTNFCGAEFIGTDLRGVDLSGVVLGDAKLGGTILSGAILNETDFSRAIIGSVDFGSCDLSHAKGLEHVVHVCRSSIDVATLFESAGRIPESFLRACSVPESLIAQMRSPIAAEADQFYSCFISYSSKDEEFARQLYGRMRDAHLRVFFAPEAIQWGKKLHEQIEKAINAHDKLLIVLSEASLQSEWVMDELRKGFKAQRDSGKQKLFPLRLVDYETLKRWECRDSLSGMDLAEEVRQYFIPDFSNWKEQDQFETAFSKLLEYLRAETALAGPTQR